jgi:hypothetical protein
MPDTTITGTLGGDVEALNGRQVYIVVEDPAGLFKSPAQLLVIRETVGWSYRLDLRGAEFKQAGTFRGDIVIRACLDAACAQPLGGIPIRLPYDVEVMALSVGSKSLEVTVPFGTIPPTQRVAVNKPSATSEWNVQASTTKPDPQIGGVVTIAGGGSFDWKSSSDAYVDVVFLPARVGQHEANLRINAPINLPDRTNHLQTVDLPIRYVVTENPAIDHYFSPAQVNLEVAYGDRLVQHVVIKPVAGPGVTLYKLRHVYLTPSGVRGADWFSYDNDISPCIIREWTRADCLDRGEHRVNLVYQLTGPKGSREVVLPVVLTVR